MLPRAVNKLRSPSFLFFVQFRNRGFLMSTTNVTIPHEKANDETWLALVRLYKEIAAESIQRAQLERAEKLEAQ